MPTILLIRHAQAAFGSVDYDKLSDLGRRQSAVLCAELMRRELNVTRIVSGSLIRQRETAEIVASGFDGHVELDARWDEYDVDGILALHSTTTARLSRPQRSNQQVVSARQFQDVLDPALLDWIQTDGSHAMTETWPAFRSRIGAALQEVADSLGKGETALVFTSGGAIAASCVSLFELEERKFVDFHRAVVNASISKAVRGRRGTRLISYNDHSHFEREAPGLISYR